MKNFPFKDETFIIIGICMEVHRILGHGFSEVVYKDAIEQECDIKSIPVEREREFLVEYKGKILKHKFFADFVVFENIIVEIKATDKGFSDEHISQTLNYLKISDCQIGLLINFGRKSLEYKRLIF
jgi:GxxExxY protein